LALFHGSPRLQLILPVFSLTTCDSIVQAI
jgi:hypothetical protein